MKSIVVITLRKAVKKNDRKKTLPLVVRQRGCHSLGTIPQHRRPKKGKGKWKKNIYASGRHHESLYHIPTYTKNNTGISKMWTSTVVLMENECVKCLSFDA